MSDVFDGGFSLSVEMAGAFFMDAPTPEVQLSTRFKLPDEDRAVLVDRAERSFADNFHNRYHLFNIGAGYVW